MRAFIEVEVRKLTSTYGET